jgi:hypothetical protein
MNLSASRTAALHRLTDPAEAAATLALRDGQRRRLADLVVWPGIAGRSDGRVVDAQTVELTTETWRWLALRPAAPTGWPRLMLVVDLPSRRCHRSR